MADDFKAQGELHIDSNIPQLENELKQLQNYLGFLDRQIKTLGKISPENMSTNIKGVYAAGDVRKKSLRQIVTACSDGAIASFSVNSYLATLS